MSFTASGWTKWEPLNPATEKGKVAQRQLSAIEQARGMATAIEDDSLQGA